MKRVVLTGGSSGIGLACARAFAEKGMAVVSLDQAAPDEKIDGVVHVHCDVSSLNDVRMALAQCGGPIDVLVLNAGVMRRGPILSHPEEEFDALFGVNVKGTWLMLKEGASLLSKDATVVLVSSYRAGQTPDDPGLYAASKAAAEHIARCARGSSAFTLKIARLGPFDTHMGRSARREDATVLRPVDDAATLLLRLTEGTDAALTYDPAANDYAFGN